MNDSISHYLILGDCTKTSEIDRLPLIDLLITSPPYFNAPFDYEDFYRNYEEFLSLIEDFGNRFFARIAPKGIISLNIDDMLVKGIKYPIIADLTKILMKIGFKLRGQIIWKKPEGYIRISRRSGVFLQHPYPMYYYPDNLIENILIFQKSGDFMESKSNSELKITQDIWPMTNVLPIKGRLEENIAAFPEELPKKLINLFTREKEWVCDPFLGSGTTMKVARDLNRNSIGIEKLKELLSIIEEKVGHKFSTNATHNSIFKFLKSSNNYQIKKKRKGKSGNLSLINLALNPKFNHSGVSKYDLLILDMRNLHESGLNPNFSELLKHLRDGRILIVLYDSIQENIEKIPLHIINDQIMNQGIRLRDKITVWYKNNKNWVVKTKNNETVVFQHEYYEVLIYQKGKFDYKTKSKQEKEDSKLDKQKFLSEKWFLSLWDFRDKIKSECDKDVFSRLIELFTYNNEKVASNTKILNVSNRKISLNYVKL
ncbi:MAG: site-specific DNA-methyltransferase [Candidatus Heimdallarchaeota archaeon]|nr:site-specific DNA-methyltransferase [Candidatus Heimdallarchaeota archaeon]